MKERPILFNGEMVRAIVAGWKTQTRRVIAQQPGPSVDIVDCRPIYCGPDVENDPRPQAIWTEYLGDGEHLLGLVKCPFGAPSDRLWVRETWAPHDEQAMSEKDASMVHYRADDPTDYESDMGWKPSIHMPRWACRIVLEIVSVRVERLQDISPEDALAEGISSSAHGSYVYDFRQLWDSCYGKREAASWTANPWVWVVEFKRVEGER